MPRVNVSSSITDESAVIPAQEGPSNFVAGMIDPDDFPKNILGSLGNTQERELGYVNISSIGELHRRLKSNEPTGFTESEIIDAERSDPFFHLENSVFVGGNIYAGGTFERWPNGVKDTSWEYLFSIAENYLQYGGNLIVYGKNKINESTAEVVERAKNKNVSIDAFISPLFTQNNNIRSIVNSRQDCIAITSVPSENKAGADLRSFPSSDIDEPVVANQSWPHNNSTGFYEGVTFQIGETYEAVPLGGLEPKYPVAKSYFDRPFIPNSGNTYSYPKGRNVFSVRYFDARPTAFTFGSTSDVADYTRFFNGTVVATARGIVGMTWDCNTPEAIAIGATRGNTFALSGSAQSSSRGWWLYPVDTELDAEVDRDLDFAYNTFPTISGTTYANFINQLKSEGGITYFDNSRFRTRPGEILIIQRLANFVDYNTSRLLDTWKFDGGPTIKLEGNSYGTGIFAGKNQSLNANFIPGNYYDPYTFTMDLRKSQIDNPVFQTDPPEFGILANAQTTRTRTQEEDLEHGINTVFFDLGCRDDVNGQNIAINQLTNNYSRIELMDLTRTLDDRYKPIDYLYGPTFGNNPNSFLFEKMQELTKSTYDEEDNGIFGKRPVHDVASRDFKRLYNVFGPSGPTSGTDSNGNSPLTFWGCTCSQIPEYLKTFNLIGITPDVCFEVGPNSRTQDVTAEGSTYTAYIGFSDAMPRIFMKPMVNIFGEEIGIHTAAGTTFQRFYKSFSDEDTLNSNYTSEDLGFSNNDTISIPTKSLIFQPLIPDNSESATHGLTKDTENVFYASVYNRGDDTSSSFNIFNFNQIEAKTDPNLRGLFSQYENIGAVSPAPLNTGLQASDILDGEEFDLSIMFNDVPTNAPIASHIAQTASVGSPFPNSAGTDINSRPLGYALSNAVGYANNPGDTYHSQIFGTGGNTLDGYFNNGIYLIAEVDFVRGLPNNANGIPSFNPADNGPFDAQDFTYENIFSSNAGLYEFPVFGEKYSTDSFENYSSEEDSKNISKSNEIPFTSDVAGVFARQFRDLQPWFSPANQSVSSITDIIAERYHLSNAEQDDLYDSKVNFIKNLDGSLRLFGDKTFADSTSTFSRVNVANLFIYLKKKLEPLGRRFLFEQNDAQSRQLFVNTAIPFLETLRGQRAISDFRVVCDETNNTPDVIDSNQFVVDIFIKPVKTINFIKLRLTNVGTSFELE